MAETTSNVRVFDTGANRNSNEGKLNYAGFFHPLVMQAFAMYMHEHRYLEDGTIRDGNNWQKGLPRETLMDSGFRHFMDWFLEYEGYESREGIVKALCGLIFNAQAYLLSVIKEEQEYASEVELAKEVGSIEPSQAVKEEDKGYYQVSANKETSISSLLTKLGLTKK